MDHPKAPARHPRGIQPLFHSSSRSCRRPSSKCRKTASAHQRTVRICLDISMSVGQDRQMATLTRGSSDPLAGQGLAPEQLGYSILSSPIGPIRLLGGPNGLLNLDFVGVDPQSGLDPAIPRRDSFLIEPRAQLIEYFMGARTGFSFVICPLGTPFQQQVWQALASIPWGETRSYGEIAAHIGRPGAARAVGAANGLNPIPIVVPCHRVIGSDGALVGYGSGLDRKRWLLVHEGALSGELPGLGFEGDGHPGSDYGPTPNGASGRNAA